MGSPPEHPAMRGSALRTDRGRLRTPWRFLLFGILLLVVANVVSLGFLLAGLEVFDPARASGTELAEVLAVFVVNGTALAAATLAAVRFVDRRTVRDVGLTFDVYWWRDLAVGLALGSGLVCGAYLAGLAVGVYDATLAPSAPPGYPFLAWLGLVSLTMVAVGVYEELIVRGYLLTNLAEGFTAVLGARLAIAGALVVSSVGFGLLHGVNPEATALAIATVALAGVFLGLGYVLTGSLALPVGAHVAWNLVHVLLGLPVSGLAVDVAVVETERSGPVLVHGGAFGPEGGLLGLAATLLGCLAVVGYARRTGRGLRDGVAIPELLGDVERPDRTPRDGRGDDERDGPASEGRRDGPAGERRRQHAERQLEELQDEDGSTGE